MERLITETLIGKAGDKICFVRYKFSRPPKPLGVSKAQPIAMIEWRHGGTSIPAGAAIAVMDDFRRGLWANARLAKKSLQLAKIEQVYDAKILYEVFVGRGEQTTDNADEVFLVAFLPSEIESFGGIQPKLDWLAKWVGDLILQEEKMHQQKITAEAKKRSDALLKKSPVRLPHESPEIDHYKNRQEVFLKLLRQEWPLLSAALDQTKSSKIDGGQAKLKEQVWLAYIADHRAIFGRPPTIKQEEAAALYNNDAYIRLMNEAINTSGNRVDKRDWQLADGWLDKGYYRMNESQLEEAFANDWKYTLGKHKGNTLARRARKIGLKFALKAGRPEKPNDLPPG